MVRDVTIYRHEDGKARVVPWIDREKPTKEEITPKGAKLMVYTVMPHDWIDMIKTKTEDEVDAILSRYVP